MRHMPTLVEVMTPFPYLVEESTTIYAAIELMKEKNCNHLPVVDKTEVVGLLSSTDIKLAQTPGHKETEFTKLTVGDICRRRVYLVDLHTRLDEVLGYMADHKLDAAVVLKSEKLAGIFTTYDACRHYSTFLQKKYLPGNDPSAA